MERVQGKWGPGLPKPPRTRVLESCDRRNSRNLGTERSGVPISSFRGTLAILITPTKPSQKPTAVGGVRALYAEFELARLIMTITILILQRLQRTLRLSRGRLSRARLSRVSPFWRSQHHTPLALTNY